jgi:hypothetical protein
MLQWPPGNRLLRLDWLIKMVLLNGRIVPLASIEKGVRLFGSPSVGIIFIYRSTGL